MSLSLLSPSESADLLLRTALVVEDADEAAEAAAMAAALEICRLCGYLPLYIGICGGVIIGYDGGREWQTELTKMLKDDRVGVIEDGRYVSYFIICAWNCLLWLLLSCCAPVQYSLMAVVRHLNDSGDRTVELLLDTSLSMVDEQTALAFFSLAIVPGKTHLCWSVCICICISWLNFFASLQKIAWSTDLSLG